MGDLQKGRKIKYQVELDRTFSETVTEEAMGENFNQCIQCGTCAGTCPISLYMDYTPRRLIAMIRAGFKNEVLSCFTIWLCASCYECTVNCPKEIKITDVMYALKQLAIKEKKHPKGFATPVLAKEFYKLVMTHGRSSELWLMINLYLKTNPLSALNSAVMGLRLMLQGRLGFKFDSIPLGHGKKGDLKKIMASIDQQRLDDPNLNLNSSEGAS